MKQILVLILLIAIKQLKGHDQNFTQPIKYAELCGGNINIQNTINMKGDDQKEDSTVTDNCSLNYYWRDFRGQIPNDAFPAGKSSTGLLRYAGQTYIEKFELLPAHIAPETDEVQSVAYDKVFNIKDDVKILCAPLHYQKYLKWIPVNVDNLAKLFQNYNVVRGGREIGKSLYVGRVKQNGSDIIGKFFGMDFAGNAGIGVAKDGHPVNYRLFDALVYDCHH